MVVELQSRLASKFDSLIFSLLAKIDDSSFLVSSEIEFCSLKPQFSSSTKGLLFPVICEASFAWSHEKK
jgi:hypothetical protein